MTSSKSLAVGTVILRAALSALLTITIGSAQQEQQLTVPRLIQFSGVLKDSQNKPLSGSVPVTFSIYASQLDNTPLWSETQEITPGADGSYSVLLGSATQGGVPADLFSKGAARWLGIQTPEQMEGPRVLLVSVPYALKAADAETLGGKPASAYVTADSHASQPSATTSTIAPAIMAQGVTPATTLAGSGNTDYVPLWINSTTLGDSILFQSGTAMEVNGTLLLRPLGIATSSTGYDSQPLDFFAYAYNSSSKAAVAQHFRWEAEPVSNNTTAPAGKLNLLYASGTGAPAETGLSISSKGILMFASGQTFPVVSGNESVSGNLSASELISTVAQGTAPLKVTSTTQVANLNASFLDGLPASAFASTGSNTFNGDQTIKGSLNVGSINEALTLQGNVTNPFTGNVSANVIGGAANRVLYQATGATIGGGGNQNAANAVLDDFGTVGGGIGNQAGLGGGIGQFATVGGGYFNQAGGAYSTVSGGAGNFARGKYSFAAGWNAFALDDYSFVWCQAGGTQCDSGGANSFEVATNGPIYFYDGPGGAGCYLSANSGSWTCSSDRNLKNNIRSIDSRSILERVAQMPISEWSMKADKGGHNHIGPMAQDFYSAFGLGDSDKYIAQGDAQGVALASIQGLYQLMQEKLQQRDEEIQALKNELQALEALLKSNQR